MNLDTVDKMAAMAQDRGRHRVIGSALCDTFGEEVQRGEVINTNLRVVISTSN